ncbi:MAG: DMT family transporter [Minwuia sp.]|nr:DMT family transporter [Minwuia sp.]
MTITGFALVLTAAFCHATWNFLVKRINGGPELIWLFSLVSIIIYLPVAAYIVVVETFAFDTIHAIFIAGSTVLHLAYFLILQAGYRRGDLSVVYPTARATGPFLSTAFAVLFLGEQMNLQIAAGAVAVLVGVACLTGGLRRGARHLLPSLMFGIGAGVLIGSYTVWDAYAVSTLMIPPLLVDYVSSAGRTLLLAPVAARRWPAVQAHWRDHRWAVIAIAAFNPLAYILVLYALITTPVVYVAPTREISVLLTVLAGSILLREGDLKRRLSWACVIMIGVALLATG